MFTQNSTVAFQPTDGRPPILQAHPVTPGGRPEAALPQAAASQGLAHMFGLDVRAAALTVLVDLMVFAGDTFSMEVLLPLGVGVAALLGLIVYKMQRKWYNDDHDSALIKSMLIALLTAIPVPLTPLIAIPGAFWDS